MNKQALVTGPKARRDLQGYVDETGLLRSPRDRFFGLGLIVSPNINILHRELINFRNKKTYHKEFKFTDVGTHNILYYKGLIDTFFSVPNSMFHASIYDKTNLDVPSHFAGNYDKAYNSFCGALIAGLISSLGDSTTDYITILADDVSTSKANHFEKEIKAKIKQVTRRNAISSIIRLESHAVTEIQLCDVLLGTIAYSFKIREGLVPRPDKAKLQLVKHLQQKLGISVLSSGIYRKAKNNIGFRINEINFS